MRISLTCDNAAISISINNEWITLPVIACFLLLYNKWWSCWRNKGGSRRPPVYGGWGSRSWRKRARWWVHLWTVRWFQHYIQGRCGVEGSLGQIPLLDVLHTVRSLAPICSSLISTMFLELILMQSHTGRQRQIHSKEYALLSVFLCPAVWLCIKMGSGNMVLMRLLQIGAKDLIVYTGDTESLDQCG